MSTSWISKENVNTTQSSRNSRTGTEDYFPEVTAFGVQTVESNRSSPHTGGYGGGGKMWPRAALSALVIGHADPGGTKVVNGLLCGVIYVQSNGEECGEDRFDSTVWTPNAVTSGK
ncbi:hypothetical protein DPMN_061189 [Dreissena polymorpha]|uniref:Uncharacterized protein n=1 Tax=Dreissena polymorpha TaxID=45954 RepID=A0A9D4HIY3_DREPO|nr:hypothetical protein DPMN_061189 [Dreissena polymorpha]